MIKKNRTEISPLYGNRYGTEDKTVGNRYWTKYKTDSTGEENRADGARLYDSAAEYKHNERGTGKD